MIPARSEPPTKTIFPIQPKTNYQFCRSEQTKKNNDPKECGISFYYITFNYMPCNIPSALLNIRLAFSISGPISNITVGPGTISVPISVIGLAFLQFDWLTFCVGFLCNCLLVKLAEKY